MRLIAITIHCCKHRLYMGFYGVFLTCRFFDRVNLFCFFMRFSLSFGTRNPAIFRCFFNKSHEKSCMKNSVDKFIVFSSILGHFGYPFGPQNDQIRSQLGPSLRKGVLGRSWG